ncbi:MAG TPA: histidine phosphatase family protein [Thermomicrobiales bacterium]|nr:histidine phosphatase family protein [Thermomicrobiales bacterium]
MRLLLVRHGQSVGNIEQRIQGDDDPLTDRGREQAHAVADFLAKRRDITHLYASPLARAIETARIIGTAIGRDPIPTPGLAEINTGSASGARWDEWNAMNPEKAAALASFDEAWPGGESACDFSRRVLATYAGIIARHRGTGDVVTLVSHGGTLAWISARLHGDPLDAWPAERAIFINCSVSEVRFDGDIPDFLDWNQHGHLEALLVEPPR